MSNTDSKQDEALLPQTTYKNKRVATDRERFQLNAELNTYLFNNCDHEHDGYPNHLTCRWCVLDCFADLASRASVAAVEVAQCAQAVSDDAFAKQIVQLHAATRDTPVVAREGIRAAAEAVGEYLQAPPSMWDTIERLITQRLAATTSPDSDKLNDSVSD